MKKLVIAFAFMLVSIVPAQAQYQDLIDAKITQLVQIQKQVAVSSLAEPARDAALDTLTENLMLLTKHRDEVDLAKLQDLELTINQINRTLATQILTSKKVRMQQKLDQLASVISQKKSEGKDTVALEALWEKMNTALQNL